MTLPSGSRLGPYDIFSPLGVGGFGEVYKVRDTRLDRTVAIKILPSADPELKARLRLPLGPYAAPRVSRNGKQIAFERDDEREASIWKYRLAGGRAAQRLTFVGNNRAPVWSAAGAWIVYQSDREGDRAIFRQRADGTGTTERLTRPETGVTHTPQSSSSDGTYWLFSAQKGSQSSPWTMTLKDRKGTAYGDMNAREAFSPDGR